MALITPQRLIQSRKQFVMWEVMGFPPAGVTGGPRPAVYSAVYIGWVFVAVPGGPATNQEVQAYGHAPHHWKEGSDFHVGIHWYLTADGAAGEDVKWDILYRGINHGGVWPLVWTTLDETVDVSGYVAMEDIHTEWTTVSGAGLLMGTQMDFRAQRDTQDAADDYPHDVIFKRLEVHYQLDSFGSMGHETKWSATA